MMDFSSQTLYKKKWNFSKHAFVVSFSGKIVTKSVEQRPKKILLQLNHTRARALAQMMSKQSKFTKKSPLFFPHCLEFPFVFFEIKCGILCLHAEQKKHPMIFDYRLMIVHLSIVSLLPFNVQNKEKISFIRNCLHTADSGLYPIKCKQRLGIEWNHAKSKQIEIFSFPKCSIEAWRKHVRHIWNEKCICSHIFI